MQRLQTKQIVSDLERKMVLLAGPRQVGKTWLAREISKEFAHSVYLNYDNFHDRTIIKNINWSEKTDLIIFDELHKMPKWKNYLKGIYDTKPKHLRILVTGSARLDVMRRVGDSLAGRYFLHHLLPFTPAELKNTQFATDLERFTKRGGFPEPFLSDSDVDANRWRQQYLDSLILTDIFDFNNVQNLRSIQLVFDILRSRVGSPISYSSIAEDVGVAPNTVKKYIGIFEALFIVFRVTPFAHNIARSLAKEPKIYFFDTGLVQTSEGAQFENLVAVSLLQHVYHKIDCLGEDWKLHYLRTKEGVEVDFALTKNNNLTKMFEAKIRDSDLHKGLNWFNNKYHFHGTQIVKELRHDICLPQGINIIRASDILGNSKNMD